MTRGLRIVVAARVAATPHQAGWTWAVLQYLLGLSRLGHEVSFVDVIDEHAVSPEGAMLERSANAAYFRGFVAEYGLHASALVTAGGAGEPVGLSRAGLAERLAAADLLLNLSGVLRDEALLSRVSRRVYVDLDPAFTQLWQHAQGIDMGLAAHTDFVTIGANIGRPECAVPTLGLPWRFTLQPVVLDQWPATPGPTSGPLTTVANWRGYGSVEHDGVFYGQKVHALRALMDLPAKTDTPFVLALSIDPGETGDLALLAANRWQLVDPAETCGTPRQYQAFIRSSKAEFGVAKSGYVASRCGWFSDRSVCYLASGRPVIAHDTGVDRVLPTGHGLFTFRTADDVVRAVASLDDDYHHHAVAARGLAEEHFDSDRVLSRLLDGLGA